MSTLCWNCHNAGTCACEWSKDLVPVPGWTAKKTHTEFGDGYLVIQCPRFIRDSDEEGTVRLSFDELMSRTVLPDEEEISKPLAV